MGVGHTVINLLYNVISILCYVYTMIATADASSFVIQNKRPSKYLCYICHVKRMKINKRRGRIWRILKINKPSVLYC